MVLHSNPCVEQSHRFKGVLELIPNRNNPINFVTKVEKVLVVVYKTSSNHFAVIYPLWGLDCSRKPICKINLLSTKVEKCAESPDRQFCVHSTRESISFTFRMADKKCQKENHTSDDWIDALSNTNDKSSFLKASKTVYKSKQIRLNLSVLDEEEE